MVVKPVCGVPWLTSLFAVQADWQDVGSETQFYYVKSLITHAPIKNLQNKILLYVVQYNAQGKFEIFIHQNIVTFGPKVLYSLVFAENSG